MDEISHPMKLKERKILPMDTEEEIITVVISISKWTRKIFRYQTLAGSQRWGRGREQGRLDLELKLLDCKIGQYCDWTKGTHQSNKNIKFFIIHFI